VPEQFQKLAFPKSTKAQRDVESHSGARKNILVGHVWRDILKLCFIKWHILVYFTFLSDSGAPKRCGAWGKLHLLFPSQRASCHNPQLPQKLGQLDKSHSCGKKLTIQWSSMLVTSIRGHRNLTLIYIASHQTMADFHYSLPGLQLTFPDTELHRSLIRAVAGPATWNSLPVDLRTSSLSRDTFAKKLKTYLFGCERSWGLL